MSNGTDKPMFPQVTGTPCPSCGCRDSSPEDAPVDGRRFGARRQLKCRHCGHTFTAPLPGDAATVDLQTFMNGESAESWKPW